MINYIMPIVIVLSVGLLSGIVLTLAAKFMAVEVNEAVAKVLEALPGANCGACGFAGCEDYAKNLVENKMVKANLCTPGGGPVSMQVSNILGIEFEAVAGKYAVMACSGTLDKTSYVMDFQGLASCQANKMFYRGRVACSMACLGYGDCEKACEYGAIRMENGIAIIDRCRCVGCGQCVKRCPNYLISIIPSEKRIYVACSSTDSGSLTRKNCSAGCIGCKKCEKECAFDAIKVSGNVAKIDYLKCTNCGKCVPVCPVAVIKTMR
jgi:Na+-translocating ferredoxin:NAD+ oxidoreductase RNF subunit RnfB